MVQRIVPRDAVTGRFISLRLARESPATTVVERYDKPRRKPARTSTTTQPPRAKQRRR